MSNTQTRTQSAGKVIHAVGSLVYVLEKQSIYPGEVIGQRECRGVREIQLQYAYKEDGSSRWKKYPLSNEPKLWMTDTNCSVHPRHRNATNPPSKTMLSIAIVKASYASDASLKALPWYDRHVRELAIEQTSLQVVREQERLEAVQQDEERSRLAAVQEIEREEAEATENNRAILEILKSIGSAFNMLQPLLDRSQAMDALPNCAVLSPDEFEQATNHGTELQANLLESWGAMTPFQTTCIKLMTRVGTKTGRMLQNLHLQRRTRLKASSLMMLDQEQPKVFSIEELETNENSVVILQPFRNVIRRMTAPPNSEEGQRQYRIRMLMISGLAYDMSRGAYRHPFNTLLTTMMMDGHMDKTVIEEFVRKFKIGVQPKTVDNQLKSTAMNVIAKKYYLPETYQYHHRAKMGIILKQMTDNFGQKVGGGSYFTGCTVVALYTDRSTLPPYLIDFLDISPRTEVPIELAGIESVADIGATPEVDAFHVMFVLSTISQVASLANIVGTAARGGQQRIVLREYVDKRKNSMRSQQQNRAPQHHCFSLDNATLDVEPSEVEPHWGEKEENGLDTDTVPPLWNNASTDVLWGADGYTNNVMSRNLEKFVHASVMSEDGVLERVCEDPTTNDAPIFVSTGDGAPMLRDDRGKRLHRAYVASGKQDTIKWSDPVDNAPQVVDPNETTISWTFDGVVLTANPGTLLVSEEHVNKKILLVRDGDNDGDLVVSIDGVESTKPAASFNMWVPVLGDSHDERLELNQFVVGILGLFHVLMSGLKRANELNSSALEILVATFRATDGQIWFLINCGKHDEAFREMAALVVAILLFIMEVYEKSCVENGTTPTPIGQYEWSNDIRERSGAWAQLLDIVDNFLTVKALRDACRSADIGGIHLALGRMVEMFAAVGAGEYFSLVTHFLLRSKLMSDYEKALIIQMMLNEVGLTYRANDLVVENIHALNVNIRGGSKQGVIGFLAAITKAMEQIQKKRSQFGTQESSRPPTSELGGIQFDTRIAYNVLDLLRQSGLSNLDAGAIQSITQKRIWNTSTQVYNFAGQQLHAALAQSENIGKVLSQNLWNQQIFSNACTDVSRQRVPKIRRIRTTNMKELQKSYIEMNTSALFGNLRKVPPKSEWRKQAVEIMRAAHNNEHNPPAAIRKVALLKLTGTGSRATNASNRKKYDLLVPGVSTSEHMTVVRICRLKKYAGYARRVLSKMYDGEGSAFISQVEAIRDTNVGIAARRKAAVAAVKLKKDNFEYKPPKATSAEEDRLNELMLHCKENKALRLWATERTGWDRHEVHRGRGRRGVQKPLLPQQVACLTDIATTYGQVQVEKKLKYRRIEEMKRRRKQHPQECIDEVKKRSEQIERRRGKPSRWKPAVGTAPTIPIAAIHQSMKQAVDEGRAVREGVEAAAAAAAAAAEAAAAVQEAAQDAARQKSEEREKKKQERIEARQRKTKEREKKKQERIEARQKKKKEGEKKKQERIEVARRTREEGEKKKKRKRVANTKALNNKRQAADQRKLTDAANKETMKKKAAEVRQKEKKRKAAEEAEEKKREADEDAAKRLATKKRRLARAAKK